MTGATLFLFSPLALLLQHVQLNATTMSFLARKHRNEITLTTSRGLIREIDVAMS
jgi:hypothetical protein